MMKYEVITVTTRIIRRELGYLSPRTQTEIQQRLRWLFGLS